MAARALLGGCLFFLCSGLASLRADESPLSRVELDKRIARIVYDASFVAAYVGWLQAIVLLLLLPAAYLSVQLMRWWSRLVLLSQKPTYQRAR